MKQDHRGIFQRWMDRPLLFIGRIAAGIACLLLVLFVLYPHRYATWSRLSDLNAEPNVFRTKIPEEILIAQNVFHGKIPVVDLPVKPPTKIESLSPVEKIGVTTQSFVAPPEQKEPTQEAGLAQLIEIQTKIETTPAPITAVPTQSADALSEKSEMQQEIDLPPLADPQTKNETLPPTEDPAVSSQPIPAPSKQIELPEKIDLRRAAVRPQQVKDDVIEKTQERTIHDEKWLLSQGASYYTIQLMGARREVLLFNFVEKNQLLEHNEIAFYQTTFKNKPWFQLLYGVYATKKDAQAAADNLPLNIRKGSPWIRRLSAVQKSIRGKLSP